MSSIGMSTSVLKDVFNSVKVISSNKTTYDFSNLCLMEFRDNKLTVSTTDYEFYLKISIPVSQSGFYSAVINSIRFADVLANLQNETTDIKFDEKHVKITNGRSNFKFGVVDVKPPEFPQMPSQKTMINGNIFKEMIKMVEHAVPKSQDSISGIYVVTGENSFNVFATDSYRLSTVSVKGEFPSFSFTLPVKVSRVLSKLNASDEIALYYDEGGSFIVLEDTTNYWILYVRLLDTPVIDYQNILDSLSNNCSFEVDKSVITSTLKPFIAINFESVDLMINNSIVKIHAITNEDEADDEVEVDGQGSADVTVNLKFLMDGFNTMNSGNISVSIDNENKIILMEQIKDSVELKEIIASRA